MNPVWTNYTRGALTRKSPPHTHTQKWQIQQISNKGNINTQAHTSRYRPLQSNKQKPNDRRKQPEINISNNGAVQLLNGMCYKVTDNTRVLFVNETLKMITVINLRSAIPLVTDNEQYICVHVCLSTALQWSASNLMAQLWYNIITYLSTCLH